MLINHKRHLHTHPISLWSPKKLNPTESTERPSIRSSFTLLAVMALTASIPPPISLSLVSYTHTHTHTHTQCLHGPMFHMVAPTQRTINSFTEQPLYGRCCIFIISPNLQNKPLAHDGRYYEEKKRMYIYVWLGHFAVQQKLKEQCKSTIL